MPVEYVIVFLFTSKMRTVFDRERKYAKTFGEKNANNLPPCLYVGIDWLFWPLFFSVLKILLNILVSEGLFSSGSEVIDGHSKLKGKPGTAYLFLLAERERRVLVKLFISTLSILEVVLNFADFMQPRLP